MQERILDAAGEEYGEMDDGDNGNGDDDDEVDSEEDRLDDELVERMRAKLFEGEEMDSDEERLDAALVARLRSKLQEMYDEEDGEPVYVYIPSVERYNMTPL